MHILYLHLEHSIEDGMSSLKIVERDGLLGLGPQFRPSLYYVQHDRRHAFGGNGFWAGWSG